MINVAGRDAAGNHNKGLVAKAGESPAVRHALRNGCDKPFFKHRHGCALLIPSWWPAVVGLMLTGIGTANIVPVIWGAAGRDTRMGAGPAISTVTTVRYCGFLTGPPVIGSLAVVVGLRPAMAVIALAGIIVAAGPVFFSVESTSRTEDEEAITV